MGDDDRGARILRQGLLEPLDRRQVEVVRGLVEQQDVGSGKQQLRELDAHEPAAAERPERARAGVGVESQTAEHALDPRGALEASRKLEGGAAAVVAGRELRGHVAAVRARALHLRLQGAKLPFEVVEMGEHRGDLVEDAAVAIGVDLLAQEADSNVTRDDDAAGIRDLVPRGDAQQRGLAGAVGSDQADAVVSLYAERGTPEQIASADAPGHALQSQQHPTTVEQLRLRGKRMA